MTVTIKAWETEGHLIFQSAEFESPVHGHPNPKEIMLAVDRACRQAREQQLEYKGRQILDSADMASHETPLMQDRAYWRELAALLGWTLYGWTDREAVTYITQSGLRELTGKERDAIMAAIQKGLPK